MIYKHKAVYSQNIHLLNQIRSKSKQNKLQQSQDLKQHMEKYMNRVLFELNLQQNDNEDDMPLVN